MSEHGREMGRKMITPRTGAGAGAARVRDAEADPAGHARFARARLARARAAADACCRDARHLPGAFQTSEAVF